MLGLSGVYNQILVDGLPNVLALGFVHGVSSIPGTLIDNIHISQPVIFYCVKIFDKWQLPF